MLRAIALVAALLSLLTSTLGCVPEIGDNCNTSLDCSQQGDRLCDTTQPGGYCTIFNCEPDKCPEDEGACVAFDDELDPACKTADYAEWARFQRTFCMAWCDEHSDCRTGYQCIDPRDRGAIIIDLMPHDETKICVAEPPVYAKPDAGSVADAGADGGVSIPAVCEFPGDVKLPDAGTDGGGGAGTGGGGGAGGV